MPDSLETSLDLTLDRARRRLLESWRDGAFRGRLSSSALSTATAAEAFTLAARRTGDTAVRARADRARTWIAANQNDDGGWGDSVDSPSNVSTSTLCWATLGMAEVEDPAQTGVLAATEPYLIEQFGALEPDRIARTIAARYGVDRTFSVPILTACALAGRFGSGSEAWKSIPALPFELATLPHACFAWIGLPTVSYAMPALVAMGQVHHHHRPAWFLPWRWLRSSLRRRTLTKVLAMQPGTGGYLEAAPLTSFVCMCLLSCGEHDHPIVREGLRFLCETQRDDGSWPIDTNLDTWTTTLAVNALHDETNDDFPDSFGPEERDQTDHWLRGQQSRERHPFTQAAPGAWSWTDLSGGVPDADDTPGVLLALAHLMHSAGSSALSQPSTSVGTRGIQWLLDLQNRDGGIPTFCRGWGKLPFDRSSPDLTAHTIRAWIAWRDALPELHDRLDEALARATRFLTKTQRADGAWVPLWFGNQHSSEQENPLYGTTRVLRALVRVDGAAEASSRAARWILGVQNSDGGWGGDRETPSTVEETAWAVESLASGCTVLGQTAHRSSGAGDEDSIAEELRSAIERGSAWLVEHTRQGEEYPESPVGLYFAKLWYSERLYPVVFTVSALTRARRVLSEPPGE